jgi:CheY-like chemotaxis protein
MTPRPMHTAPMAVGHNEEPITLLLYCPEEGGWRAGVWLRAGYCDGAWVPQGWRLADDHRIALRPTQWLPYPGRSGESKLVNLPDAIWKLRPPPVHCQPMSSSSTHSGQVLLLEDEALIAVALQGDLEDAGYTVAGPFTTCAGAIEWLASNRPDLAILDTVLKDGSCKEVALKLNQQGVSYIVYSGHAEDLNTCLACEGMTWVEKPATAETLLKALAGLRSTATAPV